MLCEKVCLLFSDLEFLENTHTFVITLSDSIFVSLSNVCVVNGGEEYIPMYSIEVGLGSPPPLVKLKLSVVFESSQDYHYSFFFWWSVDWVCICCWEGGVVYGKPSCVIH